MANELDGLLWHPSWTSHMGCMKGCADWLTQHGKLDGPVSHAWIWGGTGHAFIANIHEQVCPSGPTAWHTEMLFKNAAHLGLRIEGVFSDKGKADFGANQEAAWSHVRRSIDNDLPCYGWELKIPEFYVISGYDDVGYYYSGGLVDGVDGPKPWRDVGTSEIGVMEMYSVQPTAPADPEDVLRAALGFAVKHATEPGNWVYPHYSTGPAAFESWATALSEGTPNRFGQGYNAEVWLECRTAAVDFLQEAGERINGGKPFDDALKPYIGVRDSLRRVRDMYPMPQDVSEHGESIQDDSAAAILRDVASMEQDGIDALRGILDSLS